MIGRDRRVLFANKAAKTVLGDHIEGVDVRLAIRHPAAAERLIGEGGEDASRTELVGLGDRDRRWEMTLSPLPDGSRLVRLKDRSEAHASEQIDRKGVVEGKSGSVVVDMGGGRIIKKNKNKKNN